MRIPASSGWQGRLAKFAAIPVIGLIIAACTEPVSDNPTGDEAWPNLFGETANGIGFPHEVVTTEGIASAGLYLPIFLIAVVIFVLIEGLLLFMVWRFRRKDGDDSLPEQTHGNNKLEVLWTAIPATIVTLLFIVSTMVLVDIDSTSDDPSVTVEVTAFQFGWIFDYPEYEGVSVSGGGRGEGAPEMVVPINEPIRFVLKSVRGPEQTDEELEAGAAPTGGVIHSFYVPSFFFKRDIIPGRISEFEVTIEKPAVYGGQCAEFCGLAHGDMYFSVNAVERAEFDAWIAQEQSGVDADAADDAETTTETTGTEPEATAELSEETA